jgi:hypothetical protein
MAGKHRDRGTGKHDADAAAEAELSDAVKNALDNAPKKTKPTNADEMRRAVEGEK